MADLSALQALVAKAQAAVAAKDTLKAAEVKLKKARSEPEREAARDEVAEMMAIVDWHTTALVLVIDAWHCSCGNTGRSPQGLFLHQEHTRLANSTRLIPPRSESDGNELPRRIKQNEREVVLCSACAWDNAFTKYLEPPATPEEKRMALRRPGHFVSEWADLRRQGEPE